MGTDLEHVPRRFRGKALAIVSDEGARPLDAIPAQLGLLAIAQHQGGAPVAEFGDHGGHQRLIARLFAQMGHDLVVIPGRFTGLPQQGGRAAITVADIVVEDAVEQCLTSGALALGGDGGIDVQPHGVGIFTKLLHHLLAHHLAQIRGV